MSRLSILWIFFFLFFCLGALLGQAESEAPSVHSRLQRSSLLGHCRSITHDCLQRPVPPDRAEKKGPKYLSCASEQLRQV
jgi:hypothetical protein